MSTYTIPRSLYMRCRKSLLNSDKFDSDNSLRSVFVTEELAPFHDGLPEADSKAERVDMLLRYLISKQLLGEHPVLPFFLDALSSYYDPTDHLHAELTELCGLAHMEMPLAKIISKETIKLPNYDGDLGIGSMPNPILAPSIDQHLDDIGEIHGEIALGYLTRLYDQLRQMAPQQTSKFSDWVDVLRLKLPFDKSTQSQEPLFWFFIVLEQHIRLIGVDSMSELFSIYFDSLPPTDSHASFLLSKAASDIEQLSVSIAIHREDNGRIEIGSSSVKKSLACLEEIEHIIENVLTLLGRYTPPETLLPEELQNEDFSDSITNLGYVLKGISAHLAQRGKMSREYKNEIQKSYDDMMYYAGRFMEWLRELSRRATKANSYL